MMHRPTKGAGEKVKPSSRHRHSLLLPEEFAAAAAMSGSSPARRSSRGRSLSANRTVAHDQMMQPERRSSLYRSAPNFRNESNSSSITAQACTERSKRGHSDALVTNSSAATVASRKFVVELGKDDEILQVFEFSENGSLPPPGTRTIPDKVIVDSILSKRREKHSDKSNSQCEFASSSHFSSQTTATTQTILSSSTNSRESTLSSSLHSSGGLNSALRSSSLRWGSRVSLAAEDLDVSNITNSNRNSSSNRSVRFVTDFDPAPSITDPNDDESSMTQNVRSMKTLAIKSELESHGVFTGTFIEKNELIDALLKIRREEETHLSDHCAPKGGVNKRHLLYATTMTNRQNIPQSASLKSHFSNLSTNEDTYSVDDDPSIMTDHAVVMSKPMSNRVQGDTASAGVALSRQNSIIGKILTPSKLHTPKEKPMNMHRSSNSSSRRREDPNSVSVTQNSSAYNQSYDQEQSSQDDGRQSRMRSYFRR